MIFLISQDIGNVFHVIHKSVIFVPLYALKVCHFCHFPSLVQTKNMMTVQMNFM